MQMINFDRATARRPGPPIADLHFIGARKARLLLTHIYISAVRYSPIAVLQKAFSLLQRRKKHTCNLSLTSIRSSRSVSILNNVPSYKASVFFSILLFVRSYATFDRHQKQSSASERFYGANRRSCLREISPALSAREIRDIKLTLSHTRDPCARRSPFPYKIRHNKIDLPRLGFIKPFRKPRL